LRDYFDHAGEVSVRNAWEHIYRCLLWMNQSAGLAHIYDSNHMQPGGVFHERAVRFTQALQEHWHTDRRGLAGQIDVLFQGCVQELRSRVIGLEQASDAADIGTTSLVDPELESDLIADVAAVLETEGIAAARAAGVARRIEALSREFFTIGNKRKNALGEGFEDLLSMLLQRAAGVRPEVIALRRPVSALPGFLPAEPRRQGDRRTRQPKPDLALIDTDAGVTHHIVTAKWSLRQDRETQFQSEYTSYQRNKVQTAELQYGLITNEFDLARLRNVLDAIPGGSGGYVFHKVYHISLSLLEQTHGDRFSEIRPYAQTGKLQSLSDFLELVRVRFGT